MSPVVVRATLAAPLITREPLHLDGLLMAAVARRDALPPLRSQEDAMRAGMGPPPEIPIERSACGRYYLCTAMLGATVRRETVHEHRYFPLSEATWRGSMKSVGMSQGQNKPSRTPRETRIVDSPTWYALGDLDAMRELLPWVTAVGNRRGAGHGEVLSWSAEPCEAWPGFPVLARDGAALRHLPLDVEGLGEHRCRVGNVAPPYWLRPTETVIAAPVRGRVA